MKTKQQKKNLIGQDYMESQTAGEYEFVSNAEDSFSIRIKFTVSKNGEVSYSEPTFM